MKRTLLRILFLIFIPIFWFIQNVYPQDQKKDISYVVSQFGMDEGLPQSTVNDIIQTQEGYIWLATFGGLVRFDGYSFATFNRSNTEGMSYDRVVSLFEDSNENIWIGTEQGITKFSNGKAIFYPIHESGLSGVPGAFKEDGESRIWVSFEWNSYLLKDDEFIEQIPVTENATLANKALNDTTGIFLFEDRKILKSYKDTLVQIIDLEGVIESLVLDFVEYPENSGDFFIGTSGDGIIRYQDGSFKPLSFEDGIQGKDILGFYIDKHQRLWINSYSGISRWDGIDFVPISAIAINKSIDTQILSMLEDNEGNFWMGSVAEGLFRLTPSNISMIDAEDGLITPRMLSLSKMNDGTFMFGTNCAGVFTYRNNKIESAPINRFLPNLCIWSVFQDSKDRIWLSSGGLYRTSSLENKGTIFNNDNGFEGENVYAITEDSNGNIWIGCANGIFKYNESGFTTYTDENGSNYPETRSFYEDRRGAIWVGTISGVFRIENDQIDSVPLLPGGEPYIRAIYEDEEGIVWFGSYGNGIFRMEGENILNITSKNGMFDDIVSHLIEDKYGDFWIGSNRGIFRVSKNDLNDFAEGRIREVFSYSYGTGDGMNSSETNGGFQPSTIVDETGTIYFPTVNGVAVVSTDAIEFRNEAPKVYIETVRTSENEFTRLESITLPYNNSFLEVNYTAISFSDPEKVKFRYRLEGLDDTWIDVDNRRSTLFSKIPPGNYTFQIIAANNNGVWNIQGSSLEIIIIPPFWQRYWFYALVFFTISGLIGVAFYYRIGTLKKENDRQRKFSEQLIESQENERVRIAKELHDGLGQQILVVKNRVELAKQLVEPGSDLEKQLNEIQYSATSSIEDVRNISHDLRPVILEKFGLTDSVNNLCEQVQETTNLDWSYHIDDINGIFESNKEITFYRVLQEGINNILKHANATQASLIIQHINNRVYVTLYDNGIGFDVLMKNENNKGLGLMGIKERIDILRGELNIQSGSGNGTTLKIKIPREVHAG